MRKYEVIFIVKPLEEEATNAVISKFANLIKNNGGTIDKEDRWGKRKLAYTIKDCAEGFYCLFYVSCEPECVAECDRVMKLTDDILKHMIVKSEETESAAEEAPVESEE
ncbi:30S ribosomal protein S6 [Schwartzia succinivorans]|uniref:Small ribosomal subunit protein bS6 n=1 Tax=Schwartzia succinivorans DSM 10502 TaxID=1123243 RepID=A0A1M4XBK5_9FIRM|nr:30S ribosomal protein S6 [Schwartzia succinivorans]MBQ1470548.1 30S ribosomal protein S6 [Schwartzia sp. (in: firmicutes)]MBE6097948.1 30S ribosomal protein S6 [Schwartzia succinivorans]MBQ1918377.1 30S ribosomal protein S6 [Schwartzia sp. (in: firmicutes)]MBQ2047542.1 30S ribosomal protein S6 [Schwartzia sp. (in: firmicutes)]MBQ3863747.1 30S ribosomal protein S6 [Schwartzia sp. (in: firmicutes)]